jgi:monoamine oxidase
LLERFTGTPALKMMAIYPEPFWRGAGLSGQSASDDWAGDPWSRGCLSHLPPGALTSAGPALREPHGRIHFAGSERATRWAGYMDGAVRSGEAVASALEALLASGPG